MKKIYTILSFLILATSLVSAQSVAYTLYDLTKERLNATYSFNGNGKEYNITIATQGRETNFQYQSIVDNPLANFGEAAPAGGPFTQAGLKNQNFSSKGVNAPAIKITLPEDGAISHIEFVGIASGEANLDTDIAELLLGLAYIDSPTLDDYENEYSSDYIMNFRKDGKTAKGRNKYEMVNSAEGDAPKYFMVTFAEDFAYVGLTNSAKYPAIHAIRFYTNTTVGIDDTQVEELGYTQSAGHLSFTEPANVEIYNLSGAKVVNIANTTLADIAHLQGGIYIVKAKAVNGNASITKKIVLR